VWDKWSQGEVSSFASLNSIIVSSTTFPQTIPSSNFVPGGGVNNRAGIIYGIEASS